MAVINWYIDINSRNGINIYILLIIRINFNDFFAN